MEGRNSAAAFARRMVEQRVYRRADQLIVLSSAFRDILVRQYSIPEQRVHVIPGGFDAKRFNVSESRREARLKLGWPTDRPIVLAVRRLVKRMGLDDLIAGVSSLRRTIPDVLVLIAGRGALAESLQSQIDAAGLHDHVRLLGFVADEDLPRAYRAADLTVIPSVALEGFGLSAVESLGAGTPVLTMPVGGLPEVVRDLSPNLVLDGCGDEILADSLAQALSGKLSLPDADRCQSYAQHRFDWSVVARSVHHVYAQACGQTHAAPAPPANAATHRARPVLPATDAESLATVG
jgi:glycosyltransferase involved in cell wall biosynthesis